MLPSKGYFSCISCPFYDSGDCIRPHCHFRHSKKDRLQENTNTNIISTNPSTSDQVSTDGNRNVTRIKELVTEAMKQVLDRTDLIKKSDGEKLESIVNNVVSSIEPTHETSSKEFSNFPSYKPTPISELNKRHIPVVYAPTKPICFVDRLKKKDPKESLPYSPRSVNKYDSTSQNASIYKSTTNNKDDMYEPEEATSIYTYQPTQISEKITFQNNGPLTTSECKERLNENEEKLKELDKLIDEEFGQSNNITEHNTDYALSGNEHLSDHSNNCLDTRDKNGASSEKFDTLDDVIKVSNLNIPDSLNFDNNRKKLENGDVNKAKHGNDQNLDKLDIGIAKDLIQPTASKEKQTISHDNKEKKHVNKSSREHKSSSSKENKHSRLSSKNKCKKSSFEEKHLSTSCTSDNKKKESAPNSKDNSHDSSNHSGKISKPNKRISTKTYSEKDSDSCKKRRTDKSDCSYREKKERDHSKSSSSHHKTSEKNHKSRKRSHRTEESKANINSPKKVNIQEDEVSCSSDVEEVPSNEDLIIIDSSSNSSFAADELPESERNSEDSLTFSPEIQPPAKKKRALSPALPAPQKIFSERWQKAWETIALKSSVPGKMKISHVPNVSSLINAKNEIFAEAKRTVKALPATTSSVEYVPKPITRKAHIPHEHIARYPVVIVEDSSKVPSSIRQPCLNNIYDEYLKFCNPDDARRKAQEDELEISRRLHVSKTYQNAVALSLLRIRKNKGQSADQKAGGEDSEDKLLKLSSTSIPDYTYGLTLYDCFLKYLLSEEDYVKNGYPIAKKGFKNCAYIEVGARRYNKIKQPKDKWSRICHYCSKYYFVDEKGFPQNENDCFYHWGKLYPKKDVVGGGYNEYFSCCGAESGSEPCSSGRYHVANLFDEDCLEGFVSSQPMGAYNDKTIDYPGIYALDCEMCYTTKGIELTRCTVVDLNGNRVYDKVVLPDEPILDYCTRFSGITEDMLKDCNVKLKDVQRDLLKFINEETILIGHSLENDLKALRLLHKCVIDTSVLFPHRKGFPYKKSLKNLVKDILAIDIQDKDTGHDSYEDAYSCMRIMLWKVKEDAKGRKPRVIISLDSKATAANNKRLKNL